MSRACLYWSQDPPKTDRHSQTEGFGDGPIAGWSSCGEGSAALLRTSDPPRPVKPRVRQRPEPDRKYSRPFIRLEYFFQKVRFVAELDSSERTPTRWFDDAKKQRVTTALRRALELENDVKRAQNVSRRLPHASLLHSWNLLSISAQSPNMLPHEDKVGRLVSVHRDFSEQVAKLVAVDAMRPDEPRNEDREFQELWVKSCGPQSSHGRDLRPKQRVAKTLQKGFSTSCFAEDRETLRGRALCFHTQFVRSVALVCLGLIDSNHAQGLEKAKQNERIDWYNVVIFYQLLRQDIPSSSRDKAKLLREALIRNGEIHKLAEVSLFD
ncbi:hypothetical protein B0J14DRAFT_557430 [Halenospora varia]|nr:hypothetical protein B0J14DRAFT_557430 [Halenospora varia]